MHVPLLHESLDAVKNCLTNPRSAQTVVLNELQQLDLCDWQKLSKTYPGQTL